MTTNDDEQPQETQTDRILAAQAFEPVTIRVPFWRYVEETANIKLDDWQVHLCNRLERLVNEFGQRLMIHKPPQFGGSIIVAQRLVPYILGHRPELRAKIACYNIERATRHTRTAKDVLAFNAHKSYFPENDCYVKPTAPDKEWSTVARKARFDSQPSYHALGLDSGFTGDGCDLLIIDDPYASPNDAKSSAVNSKTCGFLPDTAQPRLNDQTNIILMFHRYSENDLAGYTLQLQPGKWEYLRYAAICDGDYKDENTKIVYKDPLGRRPGEVLTHRRSMAYYEEQRANPVVWRSQFQGRPSALDGEFFKVSKLQKPFLDDIPKTCRTFVRSWDLGATENDGSYTVGVLMAVDTADDCLVICDMTRGQWATHERDEQIRLCAEKDPRRTVVYLPQDPGAAGKAQIAYFRVKLRGFIVEAHPISGDKVIRAGPFASTLNLGSVKVVRGAWNADFIRELTAFPNGQNDDIVDSASDGQSYLVKPKAVTKTGNITSGHY